MGSKGRFTMKAFHEFVQHHPGFLFPAFRLQHQLQSQIFGTSFWNRVGERRMLLSNGQYVRFNEFLRMNVTGHNKHHDKHSDNATTVSDHSAILENTGTVYYRNQMSSKRKKSAQVVPVADDVSIHQSSSTSQRYSTKIDDSIAKDSTKLYKHIQGQSKVNYIAIPIEKSRLSLPLSTASTPSHKVARTVVVSPITSPTPTPRRRKSNDDH